MDPWLSSDNFNNDCYELRNKLPNNQKFDLVILAVDHSEFLNLGIEVWEGFLSSNNVIIDLKGKVPRSLNPVRL